MALGTHKPGRPITFCGPLDSSRSVHARHGSGRPLVAVHCMVRPCPGKKTLRSGPCLVSQCDGGKDGDGLCLSCGTSLERIAPESLTRRCRNSFTAICGGTRAVSHKIE